jgi:signal peptidase I
MMSRLFRLCVALIILASMTVGCTDEATAHYRFEGGSMSPALSDSEYLSIDKVAYLEEPPQRGDIVVFRRPGGRDFVKRVIGLPGETFEVRGGKVLINGTALSEPYLNEPMRVDSPARKIEPDHYFVLGDNRNNSSDSRSFGAIDISDIIGRATFVYYPFKQMRLIARPKYTAK